MLYHFFFNQVLSQIEYDDYIKKFNEKSEKFEQIATRIRNEEIPNINLIDLSIYIEEKVSDNKNKEDITFNIKKIKKIILTLLGRIFILKKQLMIIRIKKKLLFI